MNEGEFMEFMGFRHMLVDEKVEECLEQVREGKTEVHFDRGNLTDSEVREVEREFRRRLR